MSLSLLEKLCRESGVSGDENRILNIIKNEITDFADQIFEDNLGNLIVFKKGLQRPNKKVMFSAHMDEVGFIVTNITDDGFLKFSCVGGICEDVVLSKKVLIGKNKYPGIIGSKPVHFLRGKDPEKNPSIDEMFIDIGAKDKDHALEYVSLGDFISFEPNFDVCEDVIRSKAIDDRIGCFILIELIKSELPFDTYFTFVVQEEVGLRGAKVASYTVDPDCAIVIEATTAADIPNVPEHEKVCKLGEGPVISFMDKSTIYDRKLCNLALSLARQNNINVQVKQAVAGGNDSGAINVSRSGVKTLAISLPCRYLHSQVSMISRKDVDSTKLLIEKLLFKIYE